MGNYNLFICYKWKWEREERWSEAEKELRDITLHPAIILDERCGMDAFEVLWRKGLRHMATILATAYDLESSKQSGMRKVYNQLKQKVRVWIRSEYPWGHGDYIVPRVFWPCEILDLKEVQDEIKVLTAGDLLDKDNPKDREIVEQASERPSEQRVNENIDMFNTELKRTGVFLSKATEFHRKYPKMRFWFYVEFG